MKPYVFVVDTLENNETFGPALSVGLDATTLVLENLTTTVQNMAPDIIGLFPLPEAGPIGAIVGWAITLPLSGTATAIHFSRGNFGEAFLTSLLMLPIVGSTAHNMAIKSDRFIMKLADKRKRFEKVPIVGTFVKNFVPDITGADDPPETVEEPSGGKRFKTLKHKKYKWKTLRKRSRNH